MSVDYGSSQKELIKIGEKTFAFYKQELQLRCSSCEQLEATDDIYLPKM